MRLLILLLSLLPLTVFSGPAPIRSFEFNYSMLAGEFPSTEAVDIYIPLPVENSDQHILEQEIRSSLPGEVGVELKYGNRYYHIHRPANINAPIDAQLSWKVQRREVRVNRSVLTDEERDRYLAPNSLVPVGHQILDPILAEIHAMRADETPAATARAIYDWLLDNVEYKKVGTGWGNGDTFWACSERYGNCSDFHSLFISLARSEGIPARIEFGFPVPVDRDQGLITGYHCWAQFYLPGEGWVPVDVSEAVKHPEHRELYFGTHPADRIHFTTGRDIVLSETGQSAPLNYFIYPYVEVGGKPWRVKLKTEFSYR